MEVKITYEQAEELESVVNFYLIPAIRDLVSLLEGDILTGKEVTSILNRLTNLSSLFEAFVVGVKDGRVAVSYDDLRELAKEKGIQLR